MVLYVTSKPSFFSTLLFVLNLNGWFSVLSSRFITLCCYNIILFINIGSLIIYCLFFGDTSFFLYFSIKSYIFSTVSELFCGKHLENFVVLSATLSLIKSPVASAVFWIVFFEAVLSGSITYCLGWSRGFRLYLSLKFLLEFLQMFLEIFLANGKNP